MKAAINSFFATTVHDATMADVLIIGALLLSLKFLFELATAENK